MRNKLNNLIARYKDFTRTQEGRALFLSYAFFFGFTGFIGTIMFIAMWPLSLYLLFVVIAIGIFATPFIIWVRKGEKL